MRRHKFAIIAVIALIGLFWISNAPAQEQNLQIAQAPTTGLHPMTYADLEKLYLDGKISAKQYQKFLNEIKSRPVQPPVTVQPSPLPPAITPPPVNPPTVTVTPTTSLPPPVQTNKDNQINAVESKMDELLRAKAAREKAATNAPPRTSVGPKSKRDRLNELLRQYIEGKITEPEMNERRAKIIAEPE